MQIMSIVSVVLIILYGVSLPQIQGHHGRNCSPSDIRLVDTVLYPETSSVVGIVEICRGGEWGRVCNNNQIGSEDVICRQLGFLPHGVIESSTQLRGRTTNSKFLIDFVHCQGDEQLLVDCNFTPPESCNDNTSNVIVRCFEASSPQGERVDSIQTSIQMSWSEPEENQYVDEQITQYSIECSVLVSDFNHTVSLTVSNFTSTADLHGFYPDNTYNCCVTAVFETYSTKSCNTTNTSTSQPSFTTPSDTTLNSSTTPPTITPGGDHEAESCNSNTVGGVLGAIIIVLIVVVVLLVTVFVFVIFRRCQDAVSRNKCPLENTDNTMENPTYTGEDPTHLGSSHTDGSNNPDPTHCHSPQYSNLGPAYEMVNCQQHPPVNSQLQANQQPSSQYSNLHEHTLTHSHINQNSATHSHGRDSKERRLLATRYEFAEISTDVHDSANDTADHTKAHYQPLMSRNDSDNDTTEYHIPQYKTNGNDSARGNTSTARDQREKTCQNEVLQDLDQPGSETDGTRVYDFPKNSSGGTEESGYSHLKY